jgi:hypothetical protein
MGRQIIVGIVTSADEKGYFSNGLHQNAFYLKMLLDQIPNVTPLLLIPPNLPDGTRGPDSAEIFGTTAHNLDLFREKYHLDILLCVSVVFSNKYLNQFRKNGVKIAAVIYGNRYIIDQEVTAFGHLVHPEEGGVNHASHSIIRENGSYDAVWLSPHFAWQKDYIKHRNQGDRAYVCPYIWSEKIHRLKYAEDPHYKNKSPEFQPGQENNRKIFTTEPSINIVKTNLFPYQAINLAYTQGATNLDMAYFFGGSKLAVQNPHTKTYFSNFPLAKDKKCYFLQRHKFSYITSLAQVMFHHHFQNGLNYTLLEAADLKLPIVHNSEFMPELGYYYPGANLSIAAKQITKALNHEDSEDLKKYEDDCRKTVHKFHISNAENIRGYQTLLANLLNSDIEPELPQYIVDLEYKLDHGDGYISPIG